ncbi:MAG: peptidylprolyl isomerase, partial [Chloroflexi bacterium]|nr:peptidylprolyl isomerase [Chloroflexota bacterium]
TPYPTPSGNFPTGISPHPPTSHPAAVPVEIAATVNGETITLSNYQASLSRYEAAIIEVGTILATQSASERVLDDLINRQLLSQAAREADFIADKPMVEQRLVELTKKAGGEEALSDWMAANFYTLGSLRLELALEMEAAWMRDQIISAVPETAEQVLARQVWFSTSFEAERVYDQLQNGAAFDIIITNNDPQELGYLGWFPRGYLLDPKLEEAAFSLQPGQYSRVIETRLGFHILEILDYDPNRQLTQDARLLFQTQILQEWLENRKNQSQIEIFVP